jgi:hypothetical protein
MVLLRRLDTLINLPRNPLCLLLIQNPLTTFLLSFARRRLKRYGERIIVAMSRG